MARVKFAHVGWRKRQVQARSVVNGRFWAMTGNWRLAGVVTVQAEGGAFSNAACFTSLDGASFAR